MGLLLGQMMYVECMVWFTCLSVFLIIIFQVDACVCVCVLAAQSCPTLCDLIDCSLPASSVHEILQARMLEWVAVPFSKGSAQPWDQTPVSHIAGRFFTIWMHKCPSVSLSGS